MSLRSWKKESSSMRMSLMGRSLPRTKTQYRRAAMVPMLEMKSRNMKKKKKKKKVSESMRIVTRRRRTTTTTARSMSLMMMKMKTTTTTTHPMN